MKCTPRRPLVIGAAAMLAVLTTVGHAPADTAVTILEDVNSSSFGGPNTTLGWQFSVNQTILVTHVGLFDYQGDGFEASHLMGLWNDQGSLIWTDTMQAGTFHPLIDQFRYLPTASAANGSLVLTPGHEYTIGYFSDGLYRDDILSFWDDIAVSETVNYAGHGVRVFDDELTMPQEAVEAHLFGPNFMFEIVPGPSSLALLGVGLFAVRRRRR